MAAPKPKDYREKAPTDIGLGLARSAGQGLLFGFGDEVEAFARSTIKGADYQETLNAVRSELEEFRKQSPVAAYGTEFAASIPTFLLCGAGLARLGIKGAGKVGAIESGVYGAGVGEDIEERAVGGAVSGLAGGATSAVLKKILPVKSEAAKKLQKKGIPLTPGQSLRDSGSIGSTLVSALEELSTSYPGAGAPIQAKRLETLIETNKVLLNEAVKPLKINIPKNLNAKEAFDFVDDAVNKEYSNVLEKLSIQNTTSLNNKVLDILEDSILDVAEQKRVLKLVDQTINNKVVNGILPGKALKNAQTTLRQKAQTFERKGGIEGEIGVAIRQIKNTLQDEIDLQNPNAEALKKVDSVYRNLRPIEDSMLQAATQEGIYTPAQLLRAIRKADTTKRKKQVLKGQAPLQETAELAQSVLTSSFPDLGTASRLLAQDVIINPLKLGKLVGPAITSELLMSRPFGRSPTTGLLTAPEPILRSVTPAISATSTEAVLPSLMQTNQ
jgi:hypothetical protein